MRERIREGLEVFLSDGEVAFGSVRYGPKPSQDDFVVYVENAGDFLVPLQAVKDIHEGKVLLKRSALDQELLRAIRHAHEGEHEDRT